MLDLGVDPPLAALVDAWSKGPGLPGCTDVPVCRIACIADLHLASLKIVCVGQRGERWITSNPNYV